MFLVQGCGDSDPVDPIEIAQWIADTKPLDLNQAELVQEGARFSDPLSMAAIATLPIMYLDSALQDEETNCPRLIDASDRAAGIVDWRIESDCGWEDDDGQHRMEGSIVARGDENGTELVYEGFRTTARAYLCNGQETGMTMNGVVWWPVAFMPLTPDDSEEGPPETEEPRMQHFDIHIHLEISDVDASTCVLEKIELAYDVTIDRRLGPPDSTSEVDLSNIRGHVAMLTQTWESAQDSWQTISTGRWYVSAEDYGSMYGGEEDCFRYLTGILILHAGGDVAVLQPGAPASCLNDGQDVCTAWSLNGEPQPEMCGFVGLLGCSAGADAPPPWTAMFLLVGGLLWQSRRRRQRA